MVEVAAEGGALVVRFAGPPPLDARRLARELAVPIVAGSNQVRFPRGVGQGWLATLDRLVELLPRGAGTHPAASASAPVR